MSQLNSLQLRNDWMRLLRPKLKNSAPVNPSHHVLSQAELMEWLVKKGHEGIATRTTGILMTQSMLDELLDKLFEESKRFDDYIRQHRLLGQIVMYGRKNLEWGIPLVPAIYSLPRIIPLITEQDSLELASLRKLDNYFEGSLDRIDQLEANARIGQIYYSAIVNGGLLVPWKVNAFHALGFDNLVVEEFGSWGELKQPKKTKKEKNESEPAIADADMFMSRWMPDPVTELLLLKGLEDEVRSNRQHERAVWNHITEYFVACDVPKAIRPSSLRVLCKWASQSMALLLPPYMRDTLKNKHVSTCVSAETFLRLYSGKPVKKFDSSIPVRRNRTRHDQDLEKLGEGVFLLSDQNAFIATINSHLDQFSKGKSKKEVRKMVADKESCPGYICWLIAMFALKLLTKGGLVKENITNSTVLRYLSAIKAPVLNAFADHDAKELNGYDWIELLQSAIDDRSDQLSCNRIAEFGSFVSQIPEMPDFDISELDGITINKKVNANLITPQEFDQTMLHFPIITSRENRMQRLVATLAFYCGLRRGEAIHIMMSDVAGRADTELLVQSNKYYKTKNKKPRRIPLARLLPREWFNEFMDFYDERLGEEGGKIKGLLFCKPGSRMHPLNPSVLIDRFMEQLKLVTGDDTLVFHSLRHSFANWMLIRMLLPEYPQIRHDKFKLFEHDIFDAMKASSFRSQLLSSATKKADVSVRDVLSQIANYMGHSGPDITLRSYLHLFDWIISRCLLASKMTLGKSQVRELLSIQGTRKCHNKIRKSETPKKQIIIDDNVLSIARKKHIQDYVNLTKKKTLKKRRARAHQAESRPIKADDLIYLLPMMFESSYSVEETAKRHHVLIDDVLRVKKNAERLHGLVDGNGETRFPLVPMTPKGKHNIDDRDLILRNCNSLRKNDRRVRAWLNKLLLNEAGSGMEALFKTPEEANDFIGLLRQLGGPDSRIVMWYYPDSNASEEGRASAMNQWSKATGVDKNQIKWRSLWSGEPQHQSSSLGRVSVFVTEKKNSNRRSGGVQVALQLIAVNSLT